MWDGCGKSLYYWDRLGRSWREERNIDGTLYTSQWTYDSLSRVHQSTYPDGEVISHSYGANGLLSSLGSSLGINYISGVEYNSLNLPRGYVLGSGQTAEARYRYYGLDTMGYPFGALKSIQIQKDTDPMLVNREMVYDPVGNVTEIHDSVHDENIAYTYDHLDRLLSAGTPINESYTYNAIGNITAKNGQSYSYSNPAHVHAVTAFNGVSYGYDANGSMTAKGTHSIRYDTERRPVRLNDGANVLWRAAYDGNGSRRKRLDESGTIHYLGSYERNCGNGQDTTGVVTKYYHALGRLLAFRKGGVLKWVGTDHLGGTIRVADVLFSPLDQMRYTPHGVSRDAAPNLGTDHKFTSQIEDASIGLYWYNARAYDPAIGRFTCADSVVPSPRNPQSMNRYSYCYNNPVKYIDPSGHAAWDGQTLADQPQHIQDMFTYHYGDNAAARWEQEHNANHGYSGGGGGGDSENGGGGGSGGGYR